MTVIVTPLIHPAAIVRGAWELEAPMEVFLRRVAEGPTVESVTEPPPDSILYPTLLQLKELQEEIERMGGVSIDIESAGPYIICVGLTAMAPPRQNDTITPGQGWGIGTSVCLRFRLQTGAQFWPAHQLPQAVETLFDILSNVATLKVFQNGVSFDIPELEEMGFIVGGPVWDTMLMAHTAYTELPKGLQFLSTLYLGAPVWKTLVDEEDGEQEGKS